MSTSPKGKFKYNNAIFFIVVGLFIVVVSICLKHLSKDYPCPYEFVSDVFIEALAHLGIGAILIGALGILVDLDHWSNYFKDRLAEIIIDKSYMKGLSQNELVNLQTEILRAYYNDHNIGGDDGFLQHYQKNIQKLIASPFRTNFAIDLIIDFVKDADPTKLLIKETTSWHCKSNGGRIQDEVIWEPSEGEFETAKVVMIKLEHDSFPKNASSNKHEEIFDESNFNNAWLCKQGIEIPLKDKYAGLNGLKVTVMTEYTIPTNKFIGVRMAHITRDLSLCVVYPKSLKLFSEFYNMSYNSFNINDDSGFYKIYSNDWFLPDEGLAFQLLFKDQIATTGKIQIKPIK